MKSEIRPYDDSPATPPTIIPLGRFALQHAQRRAAPEPPKPDVRPAFFPPAKAPKRMGRTVVQYDSVYREKRVAVDPDKCEHPKWERQGKPGTKRYRYFKCADCGAHKTEGAPLKRGRVREFPLLTYAACSHPPECRRPRVKLGVTRVFCASCDHLLPIRHEASVLPPSADS